MSTLFMLLHAFPMFSTSFELVSTQPHAVQVGAQAVEDAEAVDVHVLETGVDSNQRRLLSLR